MQGKRSIGDRVFDGLNNLLMALMIVIMVYPMYYVLAASLSNQNLLLAYRGILWKPLGTNLDAYDVLFQNRMIGIGYRNRHGAHYAGSLCAGA